MTRGVSESFKARADSACYWEAWVACVLSRAGLCTLHHPFQITDEDHSQTWDLEVGMNPTEYMRTLEVKSVNLTFSTVKDYPFNDVLVCSQASFQKKWPGANKTGRDFLIVSRLTGSIVWLPSGSSVELGREVFDKSRSELYKVVQAKKSDLRELCDFTEVLRGY